eukprot:GHVQ01042292.1.p1 GENE.GHVQ01042292.1~~GHVQ01042292.1.p1  ORF type:complete len:1859 (-),score=190.47 GHVQ01042292.1:2213-7789(-)
MCAAQSQQLELTRHFVDVFSLVVPDLLDASCGSSSCLPAVPTAQDCLTVNDVNKQDANCALELFQESRRIQEGVGNSFGRALDFYQTHSCTHSAGEYNTALSSLDQVPSLLCSYCSLDFYKRTLLIAENATCHNAACPSLTDAHSCCDVGEQMDSAETAGTKSTESDVSVVQSVTPISPASEVGYLVADSITSSLTPTKDEVDFNSCIYTGNGSPGGTFVLPKKTLIVSGSLCTLANETHGDEPMHRSKTSMDIEDKHGLFSYGPILQAGENNESFAFQQETTAFCEISNILDQNELMADTTVPEDTSQHQPESCCDLPDFIACSSVDGAPKTGTTEAVGPGESESAQQQAIGESMIDTELRQNGRMTDTSILRFPRCRPQPQTVAYSATSPVRPVSGHRIVGQRKEKTLHQVVPTPDTSRYNVDSTACLTTQWGRAAETFVQEPNTGSLGPLFSTALDIQVAFWGSPANDGSTSETLSKRWPRCRQYAAECVSDPSRSYSVRFTHAICELQIQAVLNQHVTSFLRSYFINYCTARQGVLTSEASVDNSAVSRYYQTRALPRSSSACSKVTADDKFSQLLRNTVHPLQGTGVLHFEGLSLSLMTRGSSEHVSTKKEAQRKKREQDRRMWRRRLKYARRMQQEMKRQRPCGGSDGAIEAEIGQNDEISFETESEDSSAADIETDVVKSSASTMAGEMHQRDVTSEGCGRATPHEAVHLGTQVLLCFSKCQEIGGTAQWRHELQKGDLWAFVENDNDWKYPHKVMFARALWRGLHPLRDELEVLPVPVCATQTLFKNSVEMAAQMGLVGQVGRSMSKLGRCRARIPLASAFRLDNFNIEFVVMEMLTKLSQVCRSSSAGRSVHERQLGLTDEGTHGDRIHFGSRSQSVRCHIGCPAWIGLSNCWPHDSIEIKTTRKHAVLQLQATTELASLNSQQEAVLISLLDWLSYSPYRRTENNRSSAANPQNKKDTSRTSGNPDADDSSLDSSDRRLQKRGFGVADVSKCSTPRASCESLQGGASQLPPRFTSPDRTVFANDMTIRREMTNVEAQGEQHGSSSDPAGSSSMVLVHGVFGSGKSSLLAGAVINLSKMLANTRHHILLCSATNCAVDCVLVKLIDLGFVDFVRIGRLSEIHPNVLRYSTTSSKSNRESRQVEIELTLKTIFHTGGLRQHSSSSASRVNTASNAPPPELTHLLRGLHVGRFPVPANVWKRRRLIACTCSTACGSDVLGSVEMSTPFVLIDEAAQQTEPLTVATLLRFGAKRCLLLGDHMQLPPTVKKTPSCLQTSLLQRLVMEYNLDNVESSMAPQLATHGADRGVGLGAAMLSASRRTPEPPHSPADTLSPAPSLARLKSPLLGSPATCVSQSCSQSPTASIQAAPLLVNQPILHILRHQYRCHPRIAGLCNILFYPGISITTEPANRSPLLFLPAFWRPSCLCVSGCENSSVSLDPNRLPCDMRAPPFRVQRCSPTCIVTQNKQQFVCRGSHSSASRRPFEGASISTHSASHQNANTIGQNIAVTHTGDAGDVYHCGFLGATLCCIAIKPWGERHRELRVGKSFASPVECTVICHVILHLFRSLNADQSKPCAGFLATVSDTVCGPDGESGQVESTHVSGGETTSAQGPTLPSVGIICLYRSQVDLVKARLLSDLEEMNKQDARRGPTGSIQSMLGCSPKDILRHVQISTVDAFQGSEKDVIILSCVRSFLPSLSLPHRTDANCSSAPLSDGGTAMPWRQEDSSPLCSSGKFFSDAGHGTRTSKHSAAVHQQEETFCSCPHRLCVALSRCRHQLIVVASEPFLQGVPPPAFWPMSSEVASRNVGFSSNTETKPGKVWKRISEASDLLLQWVPPPFRPTLSQVRSPDS